MVCGMTPDEYWNGDALLARAYIEAYRIRQENQWWSEWRMGLYHMRAIESNMSKEAQYPEEPYPITDRREADEQAAAEARMERIREKALAWAQMFNATATTEPCEGEAA